MLGAVRAAAAVGAFGGLQPVPNYGGRVKDFTQQTWQPFVCVSNLPGEGLCTNAPVMSTSYCARHNGQASGRTARKREKAAENLVGKSMILLMEAGVEERVTILKGAVRIDPGELLLDEVARCAVVVRWLEEKIGTLSEQQLFFEGSEIKTTEDKQGTDSYSLTKSELRSDISRYWKLLADERKLLTRACEAALRSNIEERRVRLAERQVASLEGAVTAALLDLGLDPHSERVRTVVATRVREALEAGREMPVTVEAERVAEPVRSTVPPVSVDF